jgi:hypothetical protein
MFSMLYFTDLKSSSFKSELLIIAIHSYKFFTIIW